VNGVHDMGGMDGVGPIPTEQNERVFHGEWEGRVWAIFLALLPRLRGFRHAIERLRQRFIYLRVTANDGSTG